MKFYLAVGIGGVIGSCLRYFISLLFSTANLSGFPSATLIVNLSGAFLLAFIVFHPYITARFNPAIAAFFTTGLIGSYTTFSTIAIEVALLAKENMPMMATYLALTIFGGLLCSFAGYRTARRIAKGGVLK